MELSGKKILIGVCGSIAAYKITLLVRTLVKEGAEVRLVMTEAASDFIPALTLGVLSKNPVLSQFTEEKNGIWNNHVELGAWADVYLIAPVTANTLGKMAHGICDNLLLAVYLSAKCPVYFAPAMDLDMHNHPSTRANIKTLESYGNRLIPAEAGELASGLIGEGRMAEPKKLHEVLVAHLREHSQKKSEEIAFTGKKVLVTAGPTYEAIDPVRFIGNHSSGKMGFALADELANAGADVTLITGPTNLQATHSNIEVVSILSAEEMLHACMERFPGQDIVIMSAAVADYTPIEVAPNKIKKKGAALSIELKPTVDILKELGTLKKEHQVLVGFALETENEIEHAKGKLERKNLDLIVLNSLKDEGAGFGGDQNKVTIIGKDNNIVEYKLKPKAAVARDIANAISELL
ncbi:MAG: bifunctional phosphopantothenoylcysteine decarboxylase/phosphopantothenate--cysteine ligase CoaBC [Flavobacteriales bacterium]|nr:bifunctional phosphopantothenoylcysteine decarboxylase/phosphopantothenate--cysteine ligase CoaBC [Flavobacteriales bacterium]